MARYSAFLGRRVEVHYRAGDILLPASGTFVADSGRSIFLEQHLIQHGQEKNFRWEIPYQYIVRMEEVKELPYPPSGTPAEASTSASRRAKNASNSSQGTESRSSSGAAAGAPGSTQPAPSAGAGRSPKDI